MANSIPSLDSDRVREGTLPGRLQRPILGYARAGLARPGVATRAAGGGQCGIGGQ